MLLMRRYALIPALCCSPPMMIICRHYAITVTINGRTGIGRYWHQNSRHQEEYWHKTYHASAAVILAISGRRQRRDVVTLPVYHAATPIFAVFRCFTRCRYDLRRRQAPLMMPPMMLFSQRLLPLLRLRYGRYAMLRFRWLTKPDMARYRVTLIRCFCCRASIIDAAVTFSLTATTG